MSSNEDENIVREYLATRFDKVIHEPDGNVSPDFLVNGKIAIEVRRLNQQFRGAKKTVGLETDQFRLMDAIRRKLSKYPLDKTSKSYFVTVSYKRPIGKLSSIVSNLEEAINKFQLAGEPIPYSCKLHQNVQFEIELERPIRDMKYKVGIEVDEDSGGWVVDTYAKDTNHCIDEKVMKIQSNYSKYPEWWLVFVDHIGFMASDDVEDIKQCLSRPEHIAKILVLDIKGIEVLEI
ncbi:hypothetical protein [Vibrio cholerae]|uniref:hypothetical protein n=1 Tax=Vibrio cholerae TaxID=666 RepID=UPI00307FF747